MNVRRHAHATKVEIRLCRSDGAVTLHVDDDGIGIRGVPGLGLATTRRRLEVQDGSLTLGRSPLGGTRFTARLPGRSDAKGAPEVLAR